MSGSARMAGVDCPKQLMHRKCMFTKFGVNSWNIVGGGLWSGGLMPGGS